MFVVDGAPPIAWIAPVPDRLPTSKRIYRGSQDTSTPWFYNHSVAGTVHYTLTEWTEFLTPPLGHLFYYYVRAYNDCGEGP